MTEPRDQNSVSGAGALTSEEVSTFDVPAVADGVLTVTTRAAPNNDRTFVDADGKLTVVAGEAP